MNKKINTYLLIGMSIIGGTAHAAGNQIRFAGKVSSELELPFGSTTVVAEPKSVEPVVKEASLPYKYNCTNDYECMSQYDDKWMQVKSRTVTLPYNTGKAVSMAGFEWTFNRTGVNQGKSPKTVAVYINNGTEFVLAATESVYRTGDETISVFFSQPIEKSAEYRFVFTGSSDGWGYTGIEHFNPLFL